MSLVLASGGGIYSSGMLTVLESTVSGNSANFVTLGKAVGGGIANDTGIPGTPRMRNTILTGNSAPASSDVDGSLNSLGHNLFGDSTGGSGFAASDWLNVNPLLGPLRDNGGPTPTMALLPSSPAIDAGGLTDSEWDQRGPGYPRQVKGATDIGAYEVQQPGTDAILPQVTILVPGTTRSQPSVPVLALSGASAPSEQSHHGVVAVDALFALQHKEEARFMLFRSRRDASGEGQPWALEAFPAEV